MGVPSCPIFLITWCVCVCVTLVNHAIHDSALGHLSCSGWKMIVFFWSCKVYHALKRHSSSHGIYVSIHQAKMSGHLAAQSNWTPKKLSLEHDGITKSYNIYIYIYYIHNYNYGPNFYIFLLTLSSIQTYILMPFHGAVVLEIRSRQPWVSQQDHEVSHLDKLIFNPRVDV